LRSREYHRVTRGLLATLPMPAAAPTASVVAASVCLFTWYPFGSDPSISII
jgi:hypothetical protein